VQGRSVVADSQQSSGLILTEAGRWSTAKHDEGNNESNRVHKPAHRTVSGRSRKTRPGRGWREASTSQPTIIDDDPCANTGHDQAKGGLIEPELQASQQTCRI